MITTGPMSAQELQEAVLNHHVKLVPKDNSWLMKSIAKTLTTVKSSAARKFMTTGTIVLGHTIYYPKNRSPWWFHEELHHDLIHISQWEKYGLWYLGSYIALWFPILGSWWRWRWEREAFLTNVRWHAMPIEEAVETIWKEYFHPWPKKEMTDWFHMHSLEREYIKDKR